MSSRLSSLVDQIVSSLDKACLLLFGLKPTYYQADFIRRVLKREGTGKYVLVASTRAGKTTATGMLALLLALAYENEDVVVVAPTLRQSNILFGQVRNYVYSNRLLYRMVDKRKGFTREIIHLVNGSTLRMLTAKSEEGLLGFGASTLIIDETASIPDEVVKTRLLRMLASTRNKQKPLLVLLGTPHRVGFLYDAWLSDDFMRFKWTWRDAVKAGVMNPDVVDYYRRTLSEAEFKRWFEAEFIPEDEGLFFNPLVVRKCVVKGGKPSERIVAGAGYRVFAGLDVARYGGDETAFVAVRVPDGMSYEDGFITVVYYSRWQKTRIDETVSRVLSIVKKINPEVVAVDTVGLGAGAFDYLSRVLGSVVVPAFELIDRSEVFAFVKRLFDEERILLPDDEYFVKQFDTYGVRYDAHGRLRVVKKPGARDDLSDAFAMAVYAVMAYGMRGRVDVLEPWRLGF